jgi:hypothetical protein
MNYSGKREIRKFLETHIPLTPEFPSGDLSDRRREAVRGRGRCMAVEALQGAMGEFRYVYKTDIHSYYRSIDLLLLFDIVEGLTVSPWLMRVLRRYLLSATVSTRDNARWRPRGLQKSKMEVHHPESFLSYVVIN